MKSLSLFSFAAAVLLGSASPPPLDAVKAHGEVPPAAAAAPADPFATDMGSSSLALANVGLKRPGPVEPTPPAAERKAEQKSVTAPAPAAVPAPVPIPVDGAVRVVVSIPQQKAYVFKGAALIATSPVSTGKKGHETPVGTFRILQKKVHHRSNRYSNAPMPYMQRLTNYGVALHAGRLPGYAASHGCIRLPRNFAKKLYGLTSTGTPVTVTSRRPKSAKDALSSA